MILAGITAGLKACSTPVGATIYQNLSQNEFFRILKHYRDSTHYIFRGMAMGDIANSGFDPNAKPCAEALQSAQKRVRLAFFLNMAASCIILLIVINLWNSLLVHNKLLQDRKLSDKFEYLKEYSKQIADQSFYQIPSLGIQISCDDIGLLGPLTLLTFSLYSLMTLRASHCHVRCAASDRFSENPLIHALLETEKLPDKQSLPTRFLFSLPRWSLLLVPFAVCGAVILYGWYAHFHYDITQDLLVDIFSATRSTAQRLDWVGGFITLLVGLCNYESFKVSKAKEKDAHGVKQDSGTNTQNPNVNVSSTAAGSPR